MKTVDVCAIQVPLEDGLTFTQVTNLLKLLQNNEEVIPFNVSENNSTAHGFISMTALEKGIEEEVIYAKLREVLDDVNKETPDGLYELENGVIMSLRYGEVPPTKVFNKETIVNVAYISIWDGDEIRSSAKLNTEIGLVFDIETVDVGNNYNCCEGEYIEYEDGIRKPVFLNDYNGQYYLKKQ